MSVPAPCTGQGAGTIGTGAEAGEGLGRRRPQTATGASSKVAVSMTARKNTSPATTRS